MRLSITHIKHGTDGGTGLHWMAALDDDNGSPQFDGSGVTIEDALCDLIEQLSRNL